MASLPHKEHAPREAVRLRGVVFDGEILLREFIYDLENIRDFAAVLEVVDAAGGDGSGRDSEIHDLVYSVQLMRQQVAGQPRAVVPITAPAEEPLQTERPLGTLAGPLLPVDVVRPRIVGNVVNPRAGG